MIKSILNEVQNEKIGQHIKRNLFFNNCFSLYFRCEKGSTIGHTRLRRVRR